MEKKYSGASSSRFGMAVICMVVLLLIAVLLVQRFELSRKIVAYTAENERLEELIDAEKERARELEKLPAYVQSDEYIEKVAREKFGLVYPDELLFKPEE